MQDDKLIGQLSKEFGTSERFIQNTLSLIDEGATTPFMARYRKEATGGMDEVVIEQVRTRIQQIRELEKRKIFVIDTIKEQGKLTAELEKQIVSCTDTQQLEDLYLPYKPKRKTRATTARENGLEPLAMWLLKEPNQDPFREASRFVKGAVGDEDAALQGARDIIAEMMSENVQARNIVRQQFERFAAVEAKVAKGKETEGIKYKDYFAFSEPLHRCPSHRLLAVFRGEEEGFLKLSIEPESEPAIDKLTRSFVKYNSDSSDQVAEAIKDSYKRLLSPSIETEYRGLAKAKADAEAIRVFQENLRQLLLAAPLGAKRILAIDPGYRTGCKVVCINEEGKLLHDGVIYPHEPQRETLRAEKDITHLVERYQIEAIAIGNGTAGRETQNFVSTLKFGHDCPVFMVNENGASVYSASEIARDEFPDKDITVRGAVSIGRRLMDPLAELVKIDPKSIGVGQYQHDVDQHLLKNGLDQVVLSCVNKVGVDVNTASKSLLTYVSGLGPQTAQNIVSFRDENGPFTSRAQLKKVPRLGEKAFEQCAGFLRIRKAKNVLDNSAVHPESYGIVDKMAKDLKCSVADLISEESLRKKIIPQHYITAEAGLPTIKDIIEELAKPGRDPRDTIKAFSFANVKSPEDLYIGMVLPGIVTNITNFGCFVDVGVKQDGMVHISHLANRFVKDPNEVVKLQQHVQVKVLEVDLVRKRISLSIKEAQ
jgi:protein Tex